MKPKKPAIVQQVVVDPETCVLSGECFKVCPRKAISIKAGKAWIDPEKCDLDGVCIPACPKGAIKLVTEAAPN